MEEKSFYNSNKIANIYQIAGSTIGVICFFAGLFLFMVNVIIAIVTIIVGGIVFPLILYTLGEIIEILSNIRENTEHLREKYRE